MLQPIVHGVLLALGLILPLGAQNVFVFNQGANQKKFTKVLPVIIMDYAIHFNNNCSFRRFIDFNVFTYVAISYIYYRPYVLLYMAWSLWNEKPNNLENHDSMSAKSKLALLYLYHY